MIPKIKNILYSTDLTENSAYAFRYAINSAVHHKANIHILHVLEIRLFPVSPPGEEGTGTLYEGPLYVEKLQKFDSEQKKPAKEKIKKRLKDFCQKELRGKSGLLKRVVSIDITEGDPASQILQKADEVEADLVIMGTHGKGWLAHAFLGSVAESVLHRIKIPIFIIPLPEKRDTNLSDVEKP